MSDYTFDGLKQSKFTCYVYGGEKRGLGIEKKEGLSSRSY